MTLVKKIVAFSFLLSLNGCYLLAPVDKSRFSDLEGQVYSLDNNGPLLNAEVKVVDPQISYNTDRNGNFILKSAPVGWSTVEIKAEGYPTLRRKIRIEPYGNKTVDFWVTKTPEKYAKESILFERDGDIWTTDEYGLSQINLTQKMKENGFYSDLSSSLSFKSPKWFADKTKIAYVMLENSPRPTTKHGIWVMNPNGKMSQRMTYIDSKSESLSVSPDGKKFVYSMQNADNFNSIGLYTFDFMRTKTESLSSTLLARDFTPKLSPDQKMVSFSGYINTMPTVDDFKVNPLPAVQRSQIFTVDTKGFNRKQLTNLGENYDPSWSADGSKILFVSTRSGNSEIWMMNKDGSAQKRITSIGASKISNPKWSADGERIIFNCSLKQNYKSLEPTELWITEPSTYTTRMISNDAFNPDW